MIKKMAAAVSLLGIMMIASLWLQGCCAFKATANRHATVPGTFNGYKLIKADWFSVNEVFRARYGRISEKLVIGFCDHVRKEVWYTEGIEDRFLEKFRWYVSNKEHEMMHALGDDLGEHEKRMWEFRYAKRSRELERWIQEMDRWRR